MSLELLETDDVEERLSRHLEERLPGLDEGLHDYLGSMIASCDDVGADCCGLVELLAPFLESYGAAEDDDAAAALAKTLCETLVDAGLLVPSSDATTAASASARHKFVPVSLGSGADIDDWGLDNLPNQNNANTLVESISDALGSKQSKKVQERRQRQQEKERKKEDARAEREEQERQKAEREEKAELERFAESRCQEGAPAESRSKFRGAGGKDVILPNVSIYVGGGRMLFDSTTVKIVGGRKYGLIGRNGVGKTTLLKHISRGKIDGFPRHLSVVHVEQEVVGDDSTVVDVVLRADREREALLAQEKKLLQRLDAGEPVDAQMAKVYDALAAIESDKADSRARAILTGLGFSEERQAAATKSLSGGWRMRVALATALFVAPDILMLDEPTNHLDLEACVWLERYLQKYTKTLIVVSHDRAFTNNVITDVIHCENQQLQYYKGDIDVFEQTRANQRLQQQREYESQQNRREHMQKFVDKFRYNAKRASLVQSRIKALNKMTLVQEVIDDPLFSFSFPQPISELNKLLEVQDLSFGYPGSPRPLFQNVEFSVHATSRISILGPNGSGKSTLLNLMLDKLQPTKGYIQRDPKLRVAHFAQHHIESLDLRKSPLEDLAGRFPGTKEEELRPHLARYGIPASLAEQRIGTLSGGQKSRVAFAAVTWTRPHVLILDEPTNHLDLETVEALIVAISTFDGGIVFVSHDQHLIEMCAEEFWVIKDFKLTQFKGSFVEYKKWAMPEDAA